MTLSITPGQGILSDDNKAERDELIALLEKAYWMELETVMSYISNSINPDGGVAVVVDALEAEPEVGRSPAGQCQEGPFAGYDASP